MGKENSIRTNTNVSSKLIGSGTGFSSYNLNQKTPKSIYSYAVVTYVSLTKLISYDIIEDNLGLNKTGVAIPLYPNKIIMPTVGSVVPLLRGPDTNIGTNAGMYDKTTYYLDPIGIQQTVNGNIIVKEVPTIATELNVSSNNIKNTSIGIAHNTPKGNIIPCPDGIYGVFWNRMPFGFQYGKYVPRLNVPNHETHIHYSFSTPQKAIEVIDATKKAGLFPRENPYVEAVDGEHSSALTWHKKVFTQGYTILPEQLLDNGQREASGKVIITNPTPLRFPGSIDPQKRLGMSLDVRADINESYIMTKEKFQKLEAFFYKTCNISNYKTNWK
jgi:hypothetical protein